MNRAAGIAWRWSWCLTLPLTLSAVSWLSGTTSRYEDFRLRYDTTPSRYSLNRIAREEAGYMWRKATAFLRDGWGRASQKSDLRQVQVFAQRSELERLDAHLPQSGFDYVDAGILFDGSIRRVKLRYRGDFAIHWAHPKKSLRVKTRKTQLFEGMRRFNLIVPKFDGILNNHMSYRLAALLGLVAPKTEMVVVGLNGEPYGLANMVEQLDEGTLRRLHRMPGDLYAGELMGKDDWIGASGNVFAHPGLWAKMAINNHFEPDSHAPLKALTDLLAERPSSARTERLGELMNLDAWARFAAFETLTQCFHYDSVHNWRLYYDPWRTRFEPVVWDPAGWTPVWLPKKGKPVTQDVIVSQLHEALYANGEFIRRKNEVLLSFFRSGMAEIYLQEFRDTVDRVAPWLDVDQALPKSGEEHLRQMKKLLGAVEQIFADVGQEVRGRGLKYSFDSNGRRLGLSVAGRTSPTAVVLHFDRPLTGLPRAWLRYARGDDAVEREIISLALTASGELRLETPFLANPVVRPIQGFRLQRARVEYHPGYYWVTFDDRIESARLDRVSVDYDGTVVGAVQATIPSTGDETSFSGETVPIPARWKVLPTRWEGDVHIEGTELLVGDLAIAPGTRVLLAPGANLIFKGQVTALGTADKPIRFEKADPDQDPWGTVALVGQGANGSTLRHCHMSGGSGFKEPLFEYSSMLSVHDVKGMVIDHCHLKDNAVVDDMLHVVYGSVRITNTTFENALSDAVDLDMTEAVIDRCVFDTSGNDTLDLMTTTATVTRSTFKNAGDKGISVGEGSTLLVGDALFENNGIAIQSKDGSRAAIFHATLRDNKRDLDCYKKNWRYNSGGYLWLYKSHVDSSVPTITTDKKSRISVVDSFLASSPEETKRIRLTEVDNKSPTKASRKGYPRWEADDLDRDGLSDVLVKPTQRGNLSHE